MEDSLGDYLRQAREARHVSIENVSRVTHISVDFISALEENRLEFFSQPDFIFSCLRLYSVKLGLDQGEIMKRAHREIARFGRMYSQNHSHLHSPAPSHLNRTAKAFSKIGRPSDRIMKRVAITVFTVLIISLFFFIPSEYKGPEVIHSDAANRVSPARTHAVSPETAIAKGDAASPLSLPVNAPAATAPSQAGQEEAAGVIGNSDSKLYHMPGMKYYGRIQAYHRVVFDSEEAAIAAGYRKAPR